jgi:CheY-like chemotaxis protein
VDDSPDALGMISEALEDNGMTVLVARSGEAAIDLTVRVNPDVILMDALMPGMDGFETCRVLKSGDDPTPAPIIFMTGLSEPEHVVKGLTAGGVDYVTKPVVIEELIARLTIHVVNARMIRSAREALDSSGRSLLSFDRSGKLRWGSPSAVEMLKDVVPGDAANPNNQRLKEWLISCAMRPLSQSEPLILDAVTLKFVGLSSIDERLVSLRPNTLGSPSDLLSSSFSLTQREAEVLYWLTLERQTGTSALSST